MLIDGDGMIFDDRLIQNGEAGGREAAGFLWKAVMDHFQSDTGLPSDVRIVTRIYANLKGLGDVCQKSGILSMSSMVEDFARGFTGSKQLFDFVDVGVGKANSRAIPCQDRNTLQKCHALQYLPSQLSVSDGDAEFGII